MQYSRSMRGPSGGRSPRDLTGAGPHAADWWPVFARMERPAFKKEAEDLLVRLAVLREAAATEPEPA